MLGMIFDYPYIPLVLPFEPMSEVGFLLKCNTWRASRQPPSETWLFKFHLLPETLCGGLFPRDPAKRN